MLICILCLTVLLFYKSVAGYLDSDISWDFFLPYCTFKEAFHSTTPAFVAFLFQLNVFPIYYTMKHRSRESLFKATKIGLGFSFAIFLMLGIISFLLYGQSMEDTIITHFYYDMIEYRSDNVLIVLLIIIISLALMLICISNFPITFLSLRINHIYSSLVCVKACQKNNESQQVEVFGGSHESRRINISKKYMTISTILLYIILIIIAIVIYSIKTMFILVGMFTGTFIGFILPNLFFIRISKMSGKNYSLVLPIIFFGFGIFFFVISVLVSFF